MSLKLKRMKVVMPSDFSLISRRTFRDTIPYAMGAHDQSLVFHMQTTIKRLSERLSFLQQFMLAIAVVLVIGMVTIGVWTGRQIENSTINRTAAITAVYVESIVAAQLHDWPSVGIVGSETQAVLDRLFVKGPLRRKVVRFKLWGPDGSILYSSDHVQMGRRFAVGERLAAAFAGTVQTRISDLDDADNQFERERWPRLLEVYVPVRGGAQGKIIAVAEFYHSTENLDRDIRTSQQRSWLLVAIATAAIYLLLFGLVRRANSTILDQQRDLRRQLHELGAALEENERMRQRLREAGASTTTLNEQLLLRVAADLHDGPAQMIAFALMRFDELAEACHRCASPRVDAVQHLRTIHGALDTSLRDVRNIASGLVIPGIAKLSLADTARRAVRDFEHMSGQTVQAEVDQALDKAPLAIKITVYRLLQESLANSLRHAPGSALQVRVQQTEGQVLVEIVDRGPGFDPQAAALSGRLGLAFMRERVRLLGGIFEIHSTPGYGTRIRARLPLSTEEMIHA